MSHILTQKQIDLYNAIIGGKTEQDGRKIQGINEYVNLYNQQQKTGCLPKLKPLFKQILSDREQVSWLPEQFSSDKEMLSAIREFYTILSDDHLPERVKKLFESLQDYDENKIYVKNDTQLTSFSHKVFGEWDVIQNAIVKKYEQTHPQGKTKEEKYEEQREKYVKSLKSISLAFIRECLQSPEEYERIVKYLSSIGKNDNRGKEATDLIHNVTTSYEKVKDLLDNDYPEDKKLAQDKEKITLLKNFLESIKDLQKFIKPLLGNGDEPDKDEKFYGEIAYIWEILDKVTPLYNKVRNYATRKPYSIEKFKLNFENAQLLAGWDVNKEENDCCVVLRKDGLYYLAIMDKSHRKSFAQKLPSDGECYEKMDYKLLPGANKMLPKVFFSEKGIKEFHPCEQLMNNYKNGTHKKGENFSKNDCHELINFFRASIDKHKDWKKFGFKFSDTNTYEDLSGFYREVESQGYKITFRNVSVAYINSLVEEGKLYLFQIYSKDFSQYSKGTCNMHTLYWKMLFDEKNLANVIYKLNGEAEMFFRKKSIEAKITHPKNLSIENKNSRNSKKTSIFKYDLTKDQRFTVDKFQFHVPITMNFKSVKINSISDYVKQYIKEQKDFRFIGIDRGERNLLYYSVIDSKGNILEQGALNVIKNEYEGNIYETDYHTLLEERNKKRTKERQSWQTIENIKELKAGYLSQAVHKITQLMIEHRAFIVLEDLNTGFKRGRQKVESSVYQQFEKSLIDKLNYLVVDKNKILKKLVGC